MITKEGYVFIVRAKYYHPMMGRGINNETRGYENLSTNGIIPFASEEELDEAAKIFVRLNNCKKISRKHLKLLIAETMEEARSLERGHLIAIVNRSERVGIFDDVFLGPRIKGKEGIACNVAAQLEMNGYRCFSELGTECTSQTALYGARQASRQMDNAPAKIAKFLLEELK